MIRCLSAARLEEQIGDFGHEQAQLPAKLAADDGAIKDLKREVPEQIEQIKHSKPSADQPPTSESAENSRRDAELAAEQFNLQQLQAKADALSQEQENAAHRGSLLEGKVDQAAIARPIQSQNCSPKKR